MDLPISIRGRLGNGSRPHTEYQGAQGMAAGLGNRYIVAACMIGQNHINLPSSRTIAIDETIDAGIAIF